MSYNLSACQPISAGNYHQSVPRTQNLTAKVITKKNWTVETDYYKHQTSAIYENSILTIRLSYKGIENHKFRADILDTSSSFQSSYAIVIEDTCEEDEDGVKFANLNIATGGLIQPCSIIRVYQRINQLEVSELATAHS